MRLFIGVPLPYVFRDVVLDLQGRMKGFGKIRFVDPMNVHLTLKFLGDVDLGGVSVIRERLSFLREMDSFRVSLCGVGAFPGIKKPKIIWVGVGEGSAGIKKLQERIDSSLVDAGFKVDTRFHPHYTLARVRFISDREGIRKFMKESIGFRGGGYIVDLVLLMESRLSPGGSIYSVVEEFRLRGGMYLLPGDK